MNEILSKIMACFVFALSARLALGERKPKAATELKPMVTASDTMVEDKLRTLFSRERIEAIKRRELRGYKRKQDKKWRNWLEAVSR